MIIVIVLVGEEFTVNYQDAPPPSIDPPPAINPKAFDDAPPSQPPHYEAGTGYYDQYPTYPSTYHPQYGGQQQQQHSNVIIQQQPVTTILEQREFRSEDYTARFVALFICATLACCVCWPFALVACILTCVAVHNVSENQNPRPLITAAVVFIVLSFVIGIPFSIIYFTVIKK